jgi:hypothetical protein
MPGTAFALRSVQADKRPKFVDLGSPQFFVDLHHKRFKRNEDYRVLELIRRVNFFCVVQPEVVSGRDRPSFNVPWPYGRLVELAVELIV